MSHALGWCLVRAILAFPVAARGSDGVVPRVSDVEGESASSALAAPMALVSQSWLWADVSVQMLLSSESSSGPLRLSEVRLGVYLVLKSHPFGPCIVVGRPLRRCTVPLVTGLVAYGHPGFSDDKGNLTTATTLLSHHPRSRAA